jgi:hypothetical protein
VNEFVKRVLGTVLAERRLAGHNLNWTEVRGMWLLPSICSVGKARMMSLYEKLSMETN